MESGRITGRDGKDHFDNWRSETYRKRLETHKTTPLMRKLHNRRRYWCRRNCITVRSLSQGAVSDRDFQKTRDIVIFKENRDRPSMKWIVETRISCPSWKRGLCTKAILMEPFFRINASRLDLKMQMQSKGIKRYAYWESQVKGLEMKLNKVKELSRL